MRCYYTRIRMAKIKIKTNNAKFDERCEYKNPKSLKDSKTHLITFSKDKENDF